MDAEREEYKGGGCEMDKVIYFEFNNWFEGRDFPEGEPFRSIVNDYKLSDDAWCKENELCVISEPIDMSVNWCVSAKRKWVEENMPKLLTDEKYLTTFIYTSGEGTKEVVREGSYKQFLRKPDENGEVYGRFGRKFLDYKKENYGVVYMDEEQ